MPRPSWKRLLLPLALTLLIFSPFARAQKQPASQTQQTQPSQPTPPRSPTSFAFTAPGLQCSIITVAAPDTDTAFLGTFYGSDQSVASGCVSIGGPQVMVVASGGDPGATSSNLLVPTRVSEVINRRLLSSEEGDREDVVSKNLRGADTRVSDTVNGGLQSSAEGSNQGVISTQPGVGQIVKGRGLPNALRPALWRQLSTAVVRSFAALINAPAPMLSLPPVFSRRPITGLFGEEEGGPLWSEFEEDSNANTFALEYGSAKENLRGADEGGLVRRMTLQDGSSDGRPDKGTGPFFTCPITPSAFWNVSLGLFPDKSSLPNSLVNGSFLLSAGCRAQARSTLFLYNRCKADIPLTFQITVSSTEYCDLYNFQRYFSNTLFVRVIVMVGGVLACVLVVFSLGCLIGICRNRRAARVRVRRNLNRVNDQIAASQGGQNVGRFVPPGAARGRAEVPMYEVTLDAGKTDVGADGAPAEANVVGRDGRAFIVVIQPGMSENPTLETLAMTGEISIATEERRRSLSRGGSGAAAETAQLRGGASGSPVLEWGPGETQVAEGGESEPLGGGAESRVLGGGEERLERQGSGGLNREGAPVGIEMFPVGDQDGR